MIRLHKKENRRPEGGRAAHLFIDSNTPAAAEE
jgi:hypothetical protein